MNEMWKKWEGQVVDHKYQLRHYLGSTDHSVVFLAEYHDPEPRQAAIKFISAEASDTDQKLAAWKNAAQLSHPSLIRIYGAGLCKIEDMDLLYVAMEYAEENLAQVLPHRALTAEETREMLNSVVAVLAYLHGKNLTHGHIKPSNVLASGELLKLSSDTITPVGNVREMRRERSAYDAPELPDSAYTPAADIWSLGVTLVEAFTQQPAVLPFNEQVDPIIPPAVRDPFLEIARHTLQREPRLRWSSVKIAERLNPAVAAARSVAAGAGASVHSAVASASPVAVATPAAAPAPPLMSPVNVSLSKEPAIPLAKQPPVRAVRPTGTRPPVREEGTAPPRTLLLPNYAVPLLAGLLVLIALIALPFVLRHRSGPEASTAKSSVPADSAANLAPPRSSPTPDNLQPTTKLPPAKSAPEPLPPVARTTHPQPATPTPAPAVLRNQEASPAPVAKNASSVPERGEALDQVTPQVLAKALATIQGTVRVVVKVHVDSAGNVSEATLDTTGPSRYFADLALKAARQWVFTPPEANGRNLPSDWLIQFGFTQAGAQATANQIQP
jgi:TonB family protein